jgi:hypothetical protein
MKKLLTKNFFVYNNNKKPFLRFGGKLRREARAYIM